MRRIVNRAICSRRDTENHSLTSVVPGPGEHGLELGDLAQELLVLRVGAEPHHPLDAGPVVPGAVEQHDLAPRRQVLHVALEVPLAPLALARRRQRHHGGPSGVEVLHEPLDRPALAGRVAALEEDDELLSGLPQPLLGLQQLDLQQPLADLVLAARHPLVVRVALAPRLDRQAVRDRSGPGRRSRPTCCRPTGRAPAAPRPRGPASASMMSDRSTTDSMSTKRSSISCSLQSRVRAR